MSFYSKRVKSRTLYESVRQHIEKKNERCASKVNKGRSCVIT